MFTFLILLFQLVVVIHAQVARKGKLLMMKSTLQSSLLEDMNSSTYRVINLPNLDNCALVLQSLLHEKYPDQYQNRMQCSIHDRQSNEDESDEEFAYKREKNTDDLDEENAFIYKEESHENEIIPTYSTESRIRQEKYHGNSFNETTNRINSSYLQFDVTSNTTSNLSIHSGSFAFGRGIPVDIDVILKGTWYALKDGMGKILKLGIKSPTAFSLNLLFDRFWLPEGAELYIHGQTAVLGAFTAAVNNKRHMKFATTPLPGSFLLIEYYAPEYVVKLPILHITSVVHGFRPISTYDEDTSVCNGSSELLTEEDANINMDLSTESEQFMGDARTVVNRFRSGNCNINAPACPEASDLLDQIKSVVIVMTSNGQKFCSGAMVNNQLQDGRQLFLTAEHCVNDFNSDFRYNIIGFNYQSKICQNNPTEWPLTETAQGLKLLARSKESDFALFELQERIPSSYNVFMAGWSATLEPPKFVASIHHPSGDVKKISVVLPESHPNIRIYLDCWNECPSKYHWKVSRWSKGVTEPGSSGAPLFNEHGLIIGQLHGGASSCKNINGFDVFGSIHASMFRSSSSSNNLKVLLDSSKSDNVFVFGAYLKDLRQKVISRSNVLIPIDYYHPPTSL